jgi:hypothetical protein
MAVWAFVPLLHLQLNCREVYKGRQMGCPLIDGEKLTSSQVFPLLAMLAWPPQMSTQVLTLASHQADLWPEGTEPAATEQQGMGVLKVVLL